MTSERDLQSSIFFLCDIFITRKKKPHKKNKKNPLPEILTRRIKRECIYFFVSLQVCWNMQGLWLKLECMRRIII